MKPRSQMTPFESQLPLALNKSIEAVEEEGARYGLKPNKAGCELMMTQQNADSQLKDKTGVKREQQPST